MAGKLPVPFGVICADAKLVVDRKTAVAPAQKVGDQGLTMASSSRSRFNTIWRRRCSSSSKETSGSTWNTHLGEKTPSATSAWIWGYIAKIYDEVKDQPVFLIECSVDLDNQSPEQGGD